MIYACERLVRADHQLQCSERKTYGRLGGPEHAIPIDLDDFIETGAGHLVDGVGRQMARRVIDEDTESAQGARRLGHQFLPKGLILDVTWYSDGLAASGAN